MSAATDSCTSWDIAVVTHLYPSNENPYKGAFIKARVQMYRAQGLRVLVVVSYNSSLTVLDVGEQDAIAVNESEIVEFISTLNVKKIFGHSLAASVLERLLKAGSLHKFVLWFHGFEARDPLRLNYNFLGVDIEPAPRGRFLQFVAIKAMLEKKELLRAILMNSRIKKVFVSKYLQNIVSEDIGVDIKNAVVIHNPVDTDYFSYSESRDRKKVLFLRPFSNYNYGFDMMSRVLQDYNLRFPKNDLSFFVCGDGPNHSRYTADLVKFPNVKIIKKIFDKNEIKQLHQNCGTMLIPTRFDTQGISMAEAMSSGILIVTNSVAAIPEFINNDEAYLCDGEDIESMIKSLRDIELTSGHRKHSVMTALARKRVVNQVASSLIINAELNC